MALMMEFRTTWRPATAKLALCTRRRAEPTPPAQPLPADGPRTPVSGEETEAPGDTVRATPRGSWIQVGLTPNLPGSHLQTEGQADAVLLRAFQLGKTEPVLETEGGDVGLVPLNCVHLKVVKRDILVCIYYHNKLFFKYPDPFREKKSK